MMISNTNWSHSYHEEKAYNCAGLMRDLKSTEFSNLVVYSQRPIERNLQETDENYEFKQHPFRPVLGLYRKYCWVDFAQYEVLKRCVTLNQPLPPIDPGSLLSNINGVTVLRYAKKNVQILKDVLCQL